MKAAQDDYLWDGSGKPDPEIQELENILGSLRHRSTAPKLPTRTKSIYSLAPMLAIAASVLMVLGVGAWIGLRSHATKEPTNASVENPIVAPKQADQVAQVNEPAQPIARDVDTGQIPRKPNVIRVKSGGLSSALHGMTPEEIKEGKEAKAQLMLAMRITSVKLNQARKKVQEDSHVVKS